MKLFRIISLVICCVLSFFATNFSYAASNDDPLPSLQYPFNFDKTDHGKKIQNIKLSGHVENGVRIIEVQAFRYGYNPDPIVVSAGEKVRLLLTSKDVMHGFGIADLGINIKIPPTKTTTFEFTSPKQVGIHNIYCTVYCGLGHEMMHGKLVIIK